jgi:hypothetical protein
LIWRIIRRLCGIDSLNILGGKSPTILLDDANLDGRGYRAMVFHVGALIRLNEVGLLRKIKRISSVSGGSITAAVLGTSWKDMKFTDDVATNFDVHATCSRQLLPA